MSEQITWTSRPTFEDHLPKIKLRTVRPSLPISGVFLNPAIDGFDTHYDKEQKISVPCLGSDHCRLCFSNHDVKWLGFVYCADQEKRHFILRVSVGGFLSLEEQIDISNLRGICFVARRAGKHINSPLLFEVGARSEGAGMPDPINIRPIVARHLGLDKRKAVQFPSAFRPQEGGDHDFGNSIPNP